MHKFFVRIFTVTLLIISLFSGSVVFASNQQNTSFSHENVKLNLKSGEDNDIYWYFNYDDSFFAESSYIYNHNLAKISLGLALSSGSPSASNIYLGSEGEGLGREKSIKHAFEVLGFTNDRYYMYDKSLNDGNTKSALAVAQKTIEVNGEKFDLIAVMPMSQGYGAEWGKNFKIGASGFHHEGFYEASQMAIDYLTDYLLNTYVNSSGNKIKLWMAGYSRGANIGNILAAQLDKLIVEENSFFHNLIDIDNFYAYNFGCSKGVIYEDNPDFLEENIRLFENIFNIVHPADILSTLPPSSWGFVRYGIDMFLQIEETSDFSPDYKAIVNTYNKMSGESFSCDIFALNSLIQDCQELFCLIIPNREYYAENLQAITIEISFMLNSAVPMENDPGKWELGSLKDRLFYQYGELAQKTYLRNDIFFSSMLFKINPKLSLVRIPFKDIYQSVIAVLTLLDLNETYLSLPIGDLVESVIALLNTYDTSIFSYFPVFHYPEMYVAWLFSSDDQNSLVRTKTMPL